MSVRSVTVVRCCIFIARMETYTMERFFLFTIKTRIVGSIRSKVEIS